MNTLLRDYNDSLTVLDTASLSLLLQQLAQVSQASVENYALTSYKMGNGLVTWRLKKVTDEQHSA